MHYPFSNSSSAILKMILALFSKLKTCTAVIARLWIVSKCLLKGTQMFKKHDFENVILFVIQGNGMY